MMTPTSETVDFAYTYLILAKSDRKYFYIYV